MPDKAAMLDKAAFAKSVHEIGDEFWEDWCDSKAAEAYALEQKIDASLVDGMHRDESDMAAEKAPWAVANVSIGRPNIVQKYCPRNPRNQALVF